MISLGPLPEEQARPASGSALAALQCWSQETCTAAAAGNARPRPSSARSRYKAATELQTAVAPPLPTFMQQRTPAAIQRLLELQAQQAAEPSRRNSCRGVNPGLGIIPEASTDELTAVLEQSAPPAPDAVMSDVSFSSSSDGCAQTGCQAALSITPTSAAAWLGSRPTSHSCCSGATAAAAPGPAFVPATPPRLRCHSAAAAATARRFGDGGSRPRPAFGGQRQQQQQRCRSALPSRSDVGLVTPRSRSRQQQFIPSNLLRVSLGAGFRVQLAAVPQCSRRLQLQAAAARVPLPSAAPTADGSSEGAAAWRAAALSNQGARSCCAAAPAALAAAAAAAAAAASSGGQVGRNGSTATAVQLQGGRSLNGSGRPGSAALCWSVVGSSSSSNRRLLQQAEQEDAASIGLATYRLAATPPQPAAAVAASRLRGKQQECLSAARAAARLAAPLRSDYSHAGRGTGSSKRRGSGTNNSGHHTSVQHHQAQRSKQDVTW